ncbi:MAG: hypothetical protein ABSD50_13865 [Smithella sp.]|jgi:glycosyltransferase involved in cell wall biosynthesis
MKTRKVVSLVIPVFGVYERVESYFFSFFTEAEKGHPYVEYVFVFDGAHWGGLPGIQRLLRDFKNVKGCIIETETYLPAILYNKGAELASGDWVVFYDPAVSWCAETFERLVTNAVECYTTHQPMYFARQLRFASYSYPGVPEEGIMFAWLFYGNVLSLSDFIIPADLFRDESRFDVTPILQKDCGWEFIFRLMKRHDCRLLGIDERGHEHLSSSFSSSLFPRPFPASKDLVRRYIIWRNSFHSDSFYLTQPVFHSAQFLSDFKQAETDYIIRQYQRFCGYIAPTAPVNRRKTSEPFHITITGGFYEYHHNVLCFYSYLDFLAGSGFATYKAVLDNVTTDIDLLGSDLVIISRGKCEEIKRIISFCKKHRILTLYMIDDNWLCIGHDWPEKYADTFKPGAPIYEYFLYAVKNCNVVLTYNPLMVEDLRPYAKHIVTLPNSVDLGRFEAIPRPKERRNFVVGYAGSQRFINAPFEALASLAGERSDIEVVLMGELPAKHETLFSNVSITRVGMQSYDQYIRNIRSLGIDILLAPADNSRTSRSKCPNKYFEITAAGAVGVYSDCEPYRWYIEDGVNGVLVINSNSVSEWKQAICSLLNRDKLIKMHTVARKRVGESYDVCVVAKQFRDLITELISEYKINAAIPQDGVR